MKKDFDSIRNTCRLNSEISADLIDTKLIYYADLKENLGKEITKKLKKYQHITSDWPDSHINFIISQLIAHRIFKENGLIHKYIHHAFVKSLSADQQTFLKLQQKIAWRYTFSKVIANPAQDFYEMEDVFSEENYLLYSPGINKSLKEVNPNMWLLLIGSNGECWQSSGLNIPLVNINPDDVFYFSTELSDYIEDESDIINDLNTNPIPYLMMLDLGISPRLHHKKHQLSYWSSSNGPLDIKFDVTKLKNKFFTAWNDHVYELKLKRYSSFPHFAVAYYDENRQMIFRYALTEAGFIKLSEALINAGFPLFKEADVHLSMPMHQLLESILERKVVMNPYEDLFATDADKLDDEEAEDSDDIVALRRFMDIAITKFNNNENVDVDAIVKQVGADPNFASKIWNNFKNKMDQI
jgi:hypothetical protein